MMIRNFYCVKLHKTAVVKWKIILFCKENIFHVLKNFVWCFSKIFGDDEDVERVLRVLESFFEFLTDFIFADPQK